MAGCIRIAGVALVAAIVSGCVTGHLLQAARRWEQATAFEQASVDGDRLVVQYEAKVSNDVGVALGGRRRRAVVSLASLGHVPLAAERVVVDRIDDAGPLPGQSVPIVVVPPSEASSQASLVVRDERVPVSIPANVFTTTSTAAWVYPLVPLALCVDATSVPVLLFFAPGAIVIGD